MHEEFLLRIPIYFIFYIFVVGDLSEFLQNIFTKRQLCIFLEVFFCSLKKIFSFHSHVICEEETF